MKWALGIAGPGRGSYVGLTWWEDCPEGDLNMVWVDLVKMCGEGGQGGGAKASSAHAGVLSGNFPVSLPFPHIEALCTNNSGICHLPGNTNAQGK